MGGPRAVFVLAQIRLERRRLVLAVEILRVQQEQLAVAGAGALSRRRIDGVFADRLAIGVVLDIQVLLAAQVDRDLAAAVLGERLRLGHHGRVLGWQEPIADIRRGGVLRLDFIMTRV